ncbi:MAG TPA: CDP-alcohol phosphatidyltransferase family protein [Candidatus Dormibacteraeota bacterium]|nr:CDP-alcohol phosphatidyltransferase family protein [Candidatus Dormibacteraeota bacterium]
MIAGLVFLAIGVAWALLSGNLVYVAWFVVVAVAGCFIPGEANQVTLARAYLAAPAFAYGTQQEFAALAVTVALAGVTDLLDGTVARRLGQLSNFGGGLDPVVDGIFMAAFVIGIAIGGAIPVWLALVVIARYLLPAIAAGILLLAGRRPELRHTLTGQISTTLILVLLGGICLFHGLHQDPGNLVTAAEIVIPIATVATYVHLGIALRRPARVPDAA